MKVLQEERTEKRRNFFTEDEFFQKLLKKHLDDEFYAYATKELEKFGETCANEIDERATHTDRDGRPQLIRYNKYGEEVSEVWVNEGYKKTVAETYGTGIVGYVHKEIPELGRKGNYTYSFAQGYLLSQAEPGFHCPVTLTLATAYLLDHYADEAVKQRFLPYICATGDVELYEGATFLTERQGGSDVGANVVQAKEEGGHYRLYGEKYFASNAGMCGVAMVLARREGAPAGSQGLTLFAVPWKKEDGSVNHLRIRRLKDKLGVRAVPSAEVEFDGAKAYVVGDPDRGFYYMMEALNLSRICNTVASISIMRRSYAEAKAYAERRDAFGKRLVEFPMVQQTLNQLQQKLEAEMAATFEMVQLYEKVTNGEATKEEEALNRLLIAIMKKESAEQAIAFAHEAIEMHGGNGYIEDFVTPRLLRDAQVLTVWEGTANILGLELIRLVNKFSAHEIFLHDLKERLDGMAALELVEQWQALKGRLDVFAEDDHVTQELKAKSMAKEMAELYERVVYVELGY
ncbi:acyl-CoA dehydrogenase family protein [Virgibacillus siamensis]|uniref:Acyl-CoA dehydrogenase family protein n=1 Tax=Virgibacillus siamensis TaxID=480071 RepID=A0ABN1GNW7_9BACI